MSTDTKDIPAPRIRTRRRADHHGMAEGCTPIAGPATKPTQQQLAAGFRPVITVAAIEELTPNPNNPRTHTRQQIRKVKRSIKKHGFVNPIIVGADGVVIAGHARLEATKLLGLTEVPVIRLRHLTAAQIIAYGIADNRLAELAKWDEEKLAGEIVLILEIDAGFDLELTGFETAEIDLMIESLEAGAEPDPADEVPDIDESVPAVSRQGDLWHLGGHRFLCADARELSSFRRLLEGSVARAVISDPPYNVAVHGHVSGMGRIRHPEFVMASGEMSDPQYDAFLQTAVANLAEACIDGALLYVFIDWRHVYELLSAACKVGLNLFNLVVWNKTNGGMGSFYRSKHELVPVFKKGQAPHINNVQLGKHGRYRTNVWTHPGANTFGKGRMDDLAAHPTDKPVALIADAIMDSTRRGDVVLDGFVGSGTIFLAAEKTGRIGYGLELDPRYVDTAIHRWERFSGKKAIHAETGLTMEELAEARGVSMASQSVGSANAGAGEGEEADHDE